MKIRFITPPKVLQKGGIENAIEGLREALAGSGVDVVDGGDPTDTTALHHFHGLWNPAHFRLAMKLCKAGRPYVVSPHGMLEPWAYRNRLWKKLPYFHLIERRLLAGAHSLFVTSAMEHDHLRLRIRHPNVVVLPLGSRDARSPDYAEARRTLGWREDEHVMVFLSRVDPKKGLHLLFDALAGNALKGGGWRLVIVGDGPPRYRAELEKQVARLGRNIPSIDWVGPVWGEERWPYLQGADLFCLPTHSENFGIAVLEALLVGTPVLTTTGTPWVEHRERDDFFICDPTVTSIRAALTDAELRIEKNWTSIDRERLSGWATSSYCWNRLVHHYVDAYYIALKRPVVTNFNRNHTGG